MGMGVDSVDASNACVPPAHPLLRQSVPLPTAARGAPVFLDGDGGRFSDADPARAPLVMYAWGKLVVVREVELDGKGREGKKGPSGEDSVGGFVYRGHAAPVTAAKFNPAGTYVASGDARGKVRVWAYDHEEHLPKLEAQVLAGPIRDIVWDFEGKRIVVVGEGMQSPESGKVIQWDTGVKCGDLASHARKKGSSAAFRPCRPMRIATGGAEDAAVFFHKGPPFQRVVGDGVVREKCHARGAVHSLRYNQDGSLLASVGTDGGVCFYEGKGMGLTKKCDKVHNSSIFACAWNRAGTHLLTCGADGYARLLDGQKGEVVHEWDVASAQVGEKAAKVPMGAMQLGCTFLEGEVPVSVGFNGQLSVLPLPSSLGLSSTAERIEKPLILTGHQAPISAMTFGALGSDTIYTADTDGVIVEWDGATGKARGRVANANDDDPALSGKVHDGATVTSLAFANGVLYSAGWDDCVRATTGRRCTGKEKLEAQPNAMARGTFVVCVVTVEGLLLVKDKAVVSEMIQLPYTATAVCLSNDDSTLYVGGDDCNIYVYSITSFAQGTSPLAESHVIKGGHLKPVQSLALSPDGLKLAAADVRDVCVYSVADYSTVVSKGRWCFHTQRIGCLSWSPDSSVIASGGNDDNIFLWCPTKKMKRVHYRFAHRGGVAGLSFVGNNGTGGGDWTLVSAGADGCVCWWDVEKDAKEKFGL